MSESPAFIAVGSNIEPRRNIIAALTLLRDRVNVRASSTFYRTKPLGGKRQPDFVNGVWRIASNLSDAQLKHDVLAVIESRLGRVRTADRFAPRTIDLDLVMCVSEADTVGVTTLPHPDVSRPFVHVPIIELLEDAGHEIEATLLAALRARLPASGAATIPGEPLDDLTAELRRLLT
ncbi:MAG: 2-amino-4-hydroxy-6-hydroxymethyldihydropteridine diphosphokinase [Sedimentisphaerales bacterium]|nr:2-amino-4-hydroxy-6-hydroxymethyldihydropteridine diphosphokinase [Sedimentisphaerales bacterium]